jgi:hypothetical protein
MFVPVLNILFGVAMILAGASGRFAFLGTDSPVLLMAIGGAVAGLGVFQLVRHARRG